MLPRQNEQAIRLRYFDSYTLAETASRLGVSLATCKRRLADGLEQLRRMLTHRECVNGHRFS